MFYQTVKPFAQSCFIERIVEFGELIKKKIDENTKIEGQTDAKECYQKDPLEKKISKNKSNVFINQSFKI